VGITNKRTGRTFRAGSVDFELMKSSLGL